MQPLPWLLLQSAKYEISAPGETSGQVWIAAAVLIVGGLVILAGRYRARVAGLTRAQRRHALRLQRGLYAQRPDTIRLRADTDFSSNRNIIRALVDPGRKHDASGVTIRGAIGDTFGELRALVGGRLQRVPVAAQRLGALGLWTAITGALAVSTGLIIQVLRTDIGGGFDLSALPQRILNASSTAIDELLAVLGSLPGGDVAVSLLVAYGLLAGQWLYTHWYVGAAALLGLAVASYLFDRRSDTPDRGAVGLPTPRYVLSRGVLVAVAVWIGIVFTGIAVDAAQDGRWIEMGAALAGVASIGGLLIGIGISKLYRAQAEWRSRTAAGHAPWPTRIALSIRALGVVTALVVAPLVPVYTVVALTKLPTVIAAFLVADRILQVAVVAWACVGVGILAWLVRSSLRDVGRGLLALVGRLSLRALILKRGIPAAAGVLAYLLTFSFLGAVIPAVVLAFIGVLLGYLFYSALEAAAYRISLWEASPTAPRTITVQAYHLQDADGWVHPVAVVNGRHRLARDDPEDLTAAVIETAEQLSAGERPDPSYASWFATDLIENGIVDERESLGEPGFLRAVEEGRVARALQDPEAPGRAWEHTRKRLIDTLRGTRGGVGRVTPRWEIDRAHNGEPEPMWSAFEDRLRRAGVITSTGDGIRLERDPWANLTE